MKLLSLEEKIFVAGSNGMVGSSICRILKKYNYGLPNKNGKIFTPTRKELNLLDTNAVDLWFKNNKPTVVIVAAAKVGGIFANSKEPSKFILENLKIQINLIEASWKFGVKRLLFLGSSCIYPKYAQQPIKEEYLMTSQLEPTNQWYALAKISGLKLCEALRKEHGFDAISLMPTNLYGPKDNYHRTNSHVLAALIKKFSDAVLNNLKEVTCWGSGKPLREFMYVDDLAEAVVFCLENWDPNNKNAPVDYEGNPLNFLNVGTGLDISILELAEKIAKITGFNGDILWDKSKPDGTPKKQLDISKIKSLGWAPKTKFSQGLKYTISKYLEEIMDS